MTIGELSSVHLPTGSDNMIWHKRVPVSGMAAEWLGSERLMTPDIQQSFDGVMSIGVQREQREPLPADITSLIDSDPVDGWVREITISAGDTLLVHALCFTPAATLVQHPWLLSLGNQPLGSKLASLGYVTRQDMSFCASDQLPPPLKSEVGAWARRSVFILDGAPLVLIEHLTDALLLRPRQYADT